MKNFNCIPIFEETQEFFYKQKFSVIYFGEHFNKRVLLLQNEFGIQLIVIKVEFDRWIVEFVKNVRRLDNEIVKSVKVTGVGNLIILLDEDSHLWKLVNQLEMSEEEEEECLCNLDESSNFLWVPFNKFKFSKVLDVKVEETKLFCLGITSDLKAKFQVLDLNNSFVSSQTILEDSSQINFSNHSLKIIKVNTQESDFGFDLDIKGTLLLLDQESRLLYLVINFKKYLIHKTNSKLINVIDLPNENCILFGFECGKLLFVFLNNQAVVSTNMWKLSKQLHFLEKCKFCNSCVVWSNGIYLYHTEFSFNFNQNYSVKCRDSKIKRNIHGVASITSIKEGFLVKTVNNNFYLVVEGDPNESGEEDNSTMDEILLEMNEKIMEMELLNKKRKITVEYLENMEIIRNPNLSKFFELSCDKNILTLKSTFQRVFSKTYWKVCLSSRCECKELVEILNLEADLNEGTVVKLETKLLPKGEVLVSLVGNFGYEFELLFVDLGKVGEEVKYLGEEDVGKNLKKIAEKRNLFWKVENEKTCK